MTNLEQLLRETLADPRHRLEPWPGMYEAVRQRAQQRRLRALSVTGAVTAVILIAGVATAVGVGSGTPRKGAATASSSGTPSPSTVPTAPPIGMATPIDLGAGSADALALDPAGIFVARTQPAELVNVSMSDLSIAKRVATPDVVDGTALDAVAGELWTWASTSSTSSTSSTNVTDSASTGGDATIIHAYATSTLAIEAATTVPSYTFAAVALDGQLWLATSDGLYVLAGNGNGSTSVSKLAGGSIFSVAADLAGHRVLFGIPATTDPAGLRSLTSVGGASSTTASASTGPFGGVAIAAIDAFTDAVTTVGTPLPVGKESIAIVGGQVWVGGYGSGSTPRLIHLDANSLRPTGGAAVDTALELGPGAIVWPGASVLWVRAGGSEGLSCVDPRTGALLERWDQVQGPVASVAGHAYALSDGSVEQLTLAGGCTG